MIYNGFSLVFGWKIRNEGEERKREGGKKEGRREKGRERGRGEGERRIRGRNGGREWRREEGIGDFKLVGVFFYLYLIRNFEVYVWGL